jgi:hypothetical protein
MGKTTVSYTREKIFYEPLEILRDFHITVLPSLLLMSYWCYVISQEIQIIMVTVRQMSVFVLS